jgi:hypothetical protein
MRISDKMFKGLKIDIPACVPVYDRYPSNELQPVQPVEYRYISVPTTIHKNLAGYLVHNYDLAPTLEKGDLIVVDRRQNLHNGETAAGFTDGFLQVGRVRIMGDELWLENQAGRTYLQINQFAGVIIAIEKSGKNSVIKFNFN